MRILICGDTHFRLEHSYASAFPDGRRSEWEAVKSKIHETAKSCDVVVLLGDNFNLRNNPSVVLREFVEFLKGFEDKPIHILCGNHERTGKNTALDFLQKLNMPNWHVYTDIRSNVQLGDATATFIPYVTPAILGVETKEEAEAIILDLPKDDLSFVHHTISGTKNTEFFNEIILDKNKLEKLFDMSFGGHIHKSERLSSKILVTGNIFTQEVGEPSKSIWIWDTKTKMLEEVSLPVRGIYKIVWEERDSKEFIPLNSIVKCYVTKKETNLDNVKEFLSNFDTSIIIEQYADERVKTHFEDGGLDLGIDNLLKLYAESKKINYEDLKQGFELIKT